MNPTFTIRTDLGDKMTFRFGTIDDDWLHNRLTVQIQNEHGKPMGAPIWKTDVKELHQFIVDIGINSDLANARNIIKALIEEQDKGVRTVETYMRAKEFLGSVVPVRGRWESGRYKEGQNLQQLPKQD